MRGLRLAGALGLVLHGLIHLMGIVVYLQIAELAELLYPTTLLGGRVDVGETVVSVLGILWGLGAVGFTVGAAGLLLYRAWWRRAVLAVTVVSLGLSLLAWPDAWVGVGVNLVILLGIMALPFRWLLGRRGRGALGSARRPPA